MKEFFNQVKTWWSQTVWKNGVYLVLAAYSAYNGHPFITGGLIGIFLYINWNTIRKIKP